MKKIIVAAFVFFAFAQTQAQVTFKPGIRAGANFSHFTQGDDYYSTYYDQNTGQNVRVPQADFTSKTDFYIGLYGALKLTKYYTLQPELNYSRQGSKIEYFDDQTLSMRKTQFDVSYISVGVINKFTFSDKFNVHIGPTIDILTDKSRNAFYEPNDYNNDYFYYSSYNDSDSDIDLAFVLGLGFNFTKNLGIEARIKKGIIPVLDFSDNDHTNVVFSAGLTYTFDLK